MSNELSNYIRSQIDHIKASLRDPFFYVCLIALWDSERFFRELPSLISDSELFQALWFSADLFNLIKTPLCYLSLSAISISGVLFLFTRYFKLTYTLLTLGYFFCSFIHFHYFRLYHRSHLLIYTLIIMSFFSSRSQREKAIDLIQGLALAIYSLTGFWKLFFIGKEMIQTMNLSFMKELLPRHIAHFFQHDFEYREAGQFLIDNPVLSSCLFLGIAVFQALSFCWYGKKQLYPFWAVGILAFHAGTYYFLNILFWQMILLIILFFLLSSSLEGKTDDFRRKISHI